MALEIERKFLVKYLPENLGNGVVFIQGYISRERNRVVRVRVEGNEAFLTIKGQKEGIIRNEYQYSIPIVDAIEILDNICLKYIIKKTRYSIEYKGNIWVIDVFNAENEGLVVAEIELYNEVQEFELPPWIGQEVTDDLQYYNTVLSDKPYTTWSDL
jgi:adenylate cyclase